MGVGGETHSSSTAVKTNKKRRKKIGSLNSKAWRLDAFFFHAKLYVELSIKSPSHMVIT